MRTTLTLDEDVAAQLKQLVEKEKKPFKQVVNDLLRMALLSRLKQGEKRMTRYSTPTLSLGACRFPDLDNTAEILSVAEGEEHP
jgi:Arc/MetJ family transcription regulator